MNIEDNYRYYNINPIKNKTGDCVIRAIACALEISWDEASDILYKNAKENYCEMSELKCYSKLLDSLPFLKHVEINKGMIVEDFIKEHQKGTYLLRLEGHLTCLKEGKIWDIWNTTKEQIDKVWSVLK